MKNASNITNPSCILIIKVTALPAGRQGNDIGDVKFNSDGDGLGRYSVYQYQHTLTGGWEYNWIGEFGEKDNFRWDNINHTGGTFQSSQSRADVLSHKQAKKQDISSNSKQFGLLAIKSFSFKKR